MIYGDGDSKVHSTSSRDHGANGHANGKVEKHANGGAAAAPAEASGNGHTGAAASSDGSHHKARQDKDVAPEKAKKTKEDETMYEDMVARVEHFMHVQCPHHDEPGACGTSKRD